MIDGIRDLHLSLEHLSNIDLVKPMDQAISLVEGAAKANCPSESGELAGSIGHFTKTEDGMVTGICQTNKSYAAYVEFGTGPKGQESHEGISPEVNPVYTQDSWWIHEGSSPNEVSRETGERYHWQYIDTPNGRFYRCCGQAAQPFMYPVLKDNEDAAVEVFRKELSKL